MAKFSMTEVVDPSANVTVLLGASTAAPLNDSDIGKPLKWVGINRYALCADGDAIEAFLVAVSDGTLDGYSYGTIKLAKPGQMQRVELDGAVTVGALVEAAAPAAVNTAEANGLGMVSVHTEDATSATTLMNTTFKYNWRLVAGSGDDGSTTAVIMCV